jgi:hypothetical protein
MARRRLPDGKRVVLALKVSQPVADAVAERRGRMPVSYYLETLICEDLGRAGLLRRDEASSAVPQARFLSPAGN